MDDMSVLVATAMASFVSGAILSRIFWPAFTVVPATEGEGAGETLRNNFGFMDGPGKMVLVVNMELKMGKGKIAAQCGHAVLGAYKRGLQCAPSAVKVWEQIGQAKICLQCPTEEEMYQIEKKAKSKGLITNLVQDAGRTQIAAGSRTVLAIGPAPEVEFRGLTDHLKLL
mmetsp:Transcript_9170/g.18283  ORF Transcript_9170/g.18283 Transcript_9170/m.18283 type:complete len:170 (+) Transcript_9170:193-702(+)|eukprot:CAMPEP_0181331692 /NCGR_PEP_ID=MMETSP1101-20121128/24653_1 /TAXON_ID=46948 /ORGANISM="Rhodomonas abbreviata, Strain Caron Lab Isolate" /LENGTH=169 /DNA_ID=CAMNT_0023441201 /DNA_START=192 /DNA_END=701 /DNA_ORIENTATION=-